MPIMIWIAIIIEAAIQSWPDMAILLCIQFLNAGISFYETTKAGDAVAALKVSPWVLGWVYMRASRALQPPCSYRIGDPPTLLHTHTQSLLTPTPSPPNPHHRPRSSPWRT